MYNEVMSGKRKNIIKTLSVLFIAVCVGIVFSGQSVMAEDFDYQQAFKDYQYNYNLYNKLYDDYRLSRARYMQYRTLVSEEEAKKATLAMLLARDETMKTYLTALRLRVMENQGLSDSEKESVFKRIDPEVKFFEEHKEKLLSVGSLKDFVRDSDKAKDRYKYFTEGVFYSALINISVGNTAYKREQIEEIISDLRSKITEIKIAGDKDVSVIDKFFVEVDNKLARSKDKELAAIDIMNQSEKSNKNKANYYNDAISSVQGSYLYLKEIVSYLKEIVRMIKVK